MATHIVDLTHTIRDGVPTYRGGTPPVLTWNSTFETRGRMTSRVSMSSHTGTHVDAPLHFLPEGLTIDALSLEAVVGPAVIVDVSHLPRRDRIVDHLAFQAVAAAIGRDEIAIVACGVDKLFGEPAFSLQYPVLQLESVSWLVSRGIRAYATDAVSVDPMDSLLQENHKILLSNGIPIVECLANLETVKGERIFLLALPLKLEGREAAPCRAIALDGI